MQYRFLGRTGVQVSRYCLGTMNFGYTNTAPDDCTQVIHQALDAGINFIDTADVYSKGRSEEIVGRALQGRRSDVVLATKCFNPMSEDRNQRGGSRRWIVRAVEDSLRRLRTDHIDLYQVHRLDWDADLDETLGALTDLVRVGKVLYLGSSSYPAEWIVEAQWVADRRNRERFVTEQPQYSIMARSVEAAVLPTCERHRMGVLVWSPLAGGWLTGKYRRGQEPPVDARFSPQRQAARGAVASLDADPRLAVVEQLRGVAAKAGLTMTGLALAFAISHRAVTSAIIGPRTVSQLDEIVATADVELDQATLEAIDGIVAPGTDALGVDQYVDNPSLRLRTAVIPGG